MRQTSHGTPTPYASSDRRRGVMLGEGAIDALVRDRARRPKSPPTPAPKRRLGGAGEGIRTLDVDLGKVALYR